MPPTTRSSTRFSSEANKGSTSKPTPQAPSASTPSSVNAPDSEDIMKTFTRRIDDEAEKQMDQAIMELYQSNKPSDLMGYSMLLNLVVNALKPQPANKFEPPELINLVKSHSGLVDKLDKCFKDGCFTPIRDLAIFRPGFDPEEVSGAHVKDLAMSLTVTVRHRNRANWTKEDLQNNNVLIYEEDVTNCAFVQDVIEQLRQPRYYSKASQKEKCAIPTYRIVHDNYPDEFGQVFKRHVGDKKERVTQDQREFMALFHVLHRVSADIEEGEEADYTSSSLTSILCNNFIHPSAFFPNRRSRTLQYCEGLAWSFSMMVHVSGDDSTYKFKPHSDWDLREKECGLPLALCEIVSESNNSDEWRMLIQAVALSRAGNLLMKSKDKLFSMIAIYLDKDLEVRRYILKPKDRSAGAKVHISQKRFQLKNRPHVILFVKEMLNLSSVVEDLAKDIDPGKQEELTKVQRGLRKYKSLTTQDGKKTDNSTKKGGRNQGTMGSIEEDPGEGNGSHFQSRNIAVLDKLGLDFGYADIMYPNVALIFYKTKDKLAEYLKFIEDGSEELDILNYLAKFDTDYNHAIHPIRFWPVQGGMMVSLPPGGRWITHVEDVSKHLGGLVRQLVEGIGFLHECNVAHLDIKPPNLVIPPAYGRLSIIDFNVSVHLKDPSNKKHDRRVGSKGYMAPEVGSVPYDPFKADLYSCGVVIKELCELGSFSSECSFFLSIADRLMADDPNRRPSMKQVLASLTVPLQTFMGWS